MSFVTYIYLIINYLFQSIEQQFKGRIPYLDELNETQKDALWEVNTTKCSKFIEKLRRTMILKFLTLVERKTKEYDLAFLNSLSALEKSRLEGLYHSEDDEIKQHLFSILNALKYWRNEEDSGMCTFGEETEAFEEDGIECDDQSVSTSVDATQSTNVLQNDTSSSFDSSCDSKPLKDKNLPVEKGYCDERNRVLAPLQATGKSQSQTSNSNLPEGNKVLLAEVCRDNTVDNSDLKSAVQMMPICKSKSSNSASSKAKKQDIAKAVLERTEIENRDSGRNAQKDKKGGSLQDKTSSAAVPKKKAKVDQKISKVVLEQHSVNISSQEKSAIPVTEESVEEKTLQKSMALTTSQEMVRVDQAVTAGVDQSVTVRVDDVEFLHSSGFSYTDDDKELLLVST